MASSFLPGSLGSQKIRALPVITWPASALPASGEELAAAVSGVTPGLNLGGSMGPIFTRSGHRASRMARQSYQRPGHSRGPRGGPPAPFGVIFEGSHPVEPSYQE